MVASPLRKSWLAATTSMVLTYQLPATSSWSWAPQIESYNFILYTDCALNECIGKQNRTRHRKWSAALYTFSSHFSSAEVALHSKRIMGWLVKMMATRSAHIDVMHFKWKSTVNCPSNRIHSFWCNCLATERENQSVQPKITCFFYCASECFFLSVNKEGTCTRDWNTRSDREIRNWFFIACLTIILIVLGAVKLNFLYYDYDYDYCYDYDYYYVFRYLHTRH